jgi:hypothetical protein
MAQSERTSKSFKEWIFQVHVTRDLVLFIVGLGGIVHEVFFWHGPERTTYLILFAAMIGLPAFLGMDQRRSG